MVRRASFFIDQVVQQLLPRRLILALGVHRRKIRRERRDVVIILPRIIRERVFAQLPARPREIKRMFQKMFGRDVIVDFVKILIHDVMP